jgi:hypothetical protein
VAPAPERAALRNAASPADDDTSDDEAEDAGEKQDPNIKLVEKLTIFGGVATELMKAAAPYAPVVGVFGIDLDAASALVHSDCASASFSVARACERPPWQEHGRDGRGEVKAVTTMTTTTTKWTQRETGLSLGGLRLLGDPRYRRHLGCALGVALRDGLDAAGAVLGRYQAPPKDRTEPSNGERAWFDTGIREGMDAAGAEGPIERPGSPGEASAYAEGRVLGTLAKDAFDAFTNAGAKSFGQRLARDTARDCAGK